MQIIKQPGKDSWTDLLQRPYNDNTKVLDAVKKIISRVKDEGDAALYAYSREFDGVDLDNLAVPSKEIEEATSLVALRLKEAIEQAISNIKKFHAAQFQPVEVIETMPGIECWRKSVGIEKIGLYIPGGSAPLFSTVLMLAIPAMLAGCSEIILCTPPGKSGRIHPVILYAAAQCGINRIFKTGGAQAIAAMAYGTPSIPKVYKIFGPGNQFVTAAKQLVQVDGVAIDMPAGPSEVCVLADDSANPVFVAADLLSQAEHGSDSQVVLISTSETMVRQTVEEIEKQLENLPRKDLAQKALNNSKAIIIDSMTTGIDLANFYAAEHLIISCRSADDVAAKIINAGSVFIGNYSPESVGDYASGTNHTLPTNGFARAYSGVSIDSFVKKITFQRLSEEGLKGISDTVISMAEAEGLEAHANAVRVRTTAGTPSKETL
ncbi:MAG TPA: histidinol dehydrogenase [Chitinophagaceae bacterium]|nr:histidinol dehydrogenase [Chitinophagaceae bacterium]